MRARWLCVVAVATACSSTGGSPGDVAPPVDGGPVDAGPVDAGPVDGAPGDAPVIDGSMPTRCGPPGSTANIATGTLAAMDATRVFLWDDGGLSAWPKGGGVTTRITTQLGSRLVVSGGALYWTHAATVVATEGGS